MCHDLAIYQDCQARWVLSTAIVSNSVPSCRQNVTTSHPHVVHSKCRNKGWDQRIDVQATILLWPNAQQPTQDEVTKGGMVVIVPHVAVVIMFPVHACTIVPVTHVRVEVLKYVTTAPRHCRVVVGISVGVLPGVLPQ